MPSTTTLERHRKCQRMINKHRAPFVYTGSVDPYCEITVGPLTLKTAVAKRTVKPKWNAPMQFLIYNLQDDVIHINVFDNEFFSPNGTSFHSSAMMHMSRPRRKSRHRLYSTRGFSSGSARRLSQPTVAFVHQTALSEQRLVGGDQMCRSTPLVVSVDARAFSTSIVHASLSRLQYLCNSKFLFSLSCLVLVI